MSHTCSLEIVAAFSAHKCHIVAKKTRRNTENGSVNVGAIRFAWLLEELQNNKPGLNLMPERPFPATW